MARPRPRRAKCTQSVKLTAFENRCPWPITAPICPNSLRGYWFQRPRLLAGSGWLLTEIFKSKPKLFKWQDPLKAGSKVQ